MILKSDWIKWIRQLPATNMKVNMDLPQVRQTKIMLNYDNLKWK